MYLVYSSGDKVSDSISALYTTAYIKSHSGLRLYKVKKKTERNSRKEQIKGDLVCVVDIILMMKRQEKLKN